MVLFDSAVRLLRKVDWKLSDRRCWELVMDSLKFSLGPLNSVRFFITNKEIVSSVSVYLR